MKIIEKIHSFDLRFFYSLRTFNLSKTADKLLTFYIYLGDGYIWGLVLLYFALFDGISKMIEVIKAVAPLVVISLVVYHAIKLTVRRKRPYELLPDIKPTISPMDKYSFPSGHTMNNLTISFGLIHFINQTGTFLTIILVLVPLSWGILRIYYGLHWLSDVLAGVILAGLCFGIGSLFM